MSFTSFKPYPNLEQLFGVCFYPHFTEEYGEPEFIQGAIHEIRSYLYGNPSEKELEDFIRNLGSYYYYPHDGFTPFTWIKHVEDFLQNYLDQTQK